MFDSNSFLARHEVSVGLHMPSCVRPQESLSQVFFFTIGMDVQRCNLVFHFDPIQQFRSYVQSKGRARAKPSRFVKYQIPIFWCLISVTNHHLLLTFTIAITVINYVLQVHRYGSRNPGRSLDKRLDKGTLLRFYLLRDC